MSTGQSIGASPRRFVADWIEDMDEDGPGKEGRSVHSSYEDAERAAIESGKRAGVIEWARVREQVKQPGGPWETIAKWVGDWEHLEEVSL